MRTIIILITIFAIPFIAFSATIHVPGDFNTIKEAMKAAVNGDVVLVHPGTYVENLNFMGKAITVKSSDGPQVTVIDGGNPVNPKFGSVVRFLNDEGLDSVIEGFTITNGKGTPSDGVKVGGGIICVGSSPSISKNIISGNECMFGGGISCRYGSLALIENNIIKENTATASYGAAWGGGIECHGAGANPSILNNIIYKNKAVLTGTGGLCASGGILFHYSASPLISGNIITENMALNGAGIGGGHEKCSPIIENNYICFNIATGGNGGAILLSHNVGTVIEISNNIIAGNRSENVGGGISVASSHSLISNNTIFANSAAISGGGIYIFGNSFGPAEVTVKDTIIWDNQAPSGPQISLQDSENPGSVLTIDFSDVEGGQSSVNVDPGCTLNWGLCNIDADPRFCEGPEGFYYLSQDPCQPGITNPCVDTGSDLATNLGMDIYWTRTDCTPDSGIVDMGFHYGPDHIFPSLQTDTFTLSESTGGEINFLLLAGKDNAHRNYILLGNFTGTDPGNLLPGGQVTLPLNWDLFTNVVIEYSNTSIFSNFMGSLDGMGSSTATLDTLGPIPGAAGLTLSFAFALNNPWDFASNPVEVQIFP